MKSVFFRLMFQVLCQVKSSVVNINYILVFFSDAMTDLDIQELANLTAGDADVDNFERLFTKLKEMKGNVYVYITKRFTGSAVSFLIQAGFRVCFYLALIIFATLFPQLLLFLMFHAISAFPPVDKASSLPHEQRKVHAEKVGDCSITN